jgi:hypothetical protein
MKRFIFLFSMLWTMCFSAHSQATITDVRFSTAQVFDVQWNVSGSTLNVSGFNYMYTSVNYATQTLSAARLTSAQTADAGANGRYIAFYNSPTVQGTYGLAVFNSDGTIYKVLNYTGSFRALANGAIFYNGNGSWGTLFTLNQGYALGSSASYAITTQYPTNAQMAAWTPTNTAPLAAGETAAPPASSYPSYVTIGGGTAGTMTFTETSTIPIGKQIKVDVWTNKTVTDGNKIYIDQVNGNSNNVTIDQTGSKNLIKGNGTDYAVLQGSSNGITINQGVSGTGQNEINFSVIGDSNTLNVNQARTTQGTAMGGNGHYQNIGVNGYTNSLTTQQSTTGVGGHYMETTINGNQNNVTTKQTDNGNKIMFTSITGNNNIVDSVQKGTGQHYLDTKLTGNGNSVTALQEGATANRATLDLTNAGGPASVILQQNGGQNVTVTTTCATAGGCAPITVRQGY